MTHTHRNPVEQQRLNDRMRRTDVLEFLLARALHAEPASPEQVKRFLATAPPEVFIALDGLLPPPSTHDARDECVHDNRILQGFVGYVMSRQKGSRS